MMTKKVDINFICSLWDNSEIIFCLPLCLLWEISQANGAGYSYSITRHH